MKKILAVLLVLAMVISVAPAAFADGGALTPLNPGKNSNLSAGKYKYTADQDCTLSWEITGYGIVDADGEYESWMGYLDEDFGTNLVISIYDYDRWEFVPVAEKSGSIECHEYDEIQFKITSTSEDAVVELNLTFGGSDEGTTGGDTSDEDIPEPGETEGDPIDVMPIEFRYGLDIKAGATVYYRIQNLYSKNLVLGGNVKVQYAVYDDETGNTWYDAEKDENGNAVVADSTLPGGTLIAITNEGTEEAHVTLDSVAPLGTSGNAKPIELDQNVQMTLSGYKDYYYKWTATAAGTITVATSADNGYEYSVDVAGVIGKLHSTNDGDDFIATEVKQVKNGDEVIVYIHHDDSENDSSKISVKLTFELATGEKDNPDAIGEDAPGKVTLDNNSGYYYKWTATDDGKVDISFAGTNGWKYNMSVNGEAGEDHASTDENAAANQSIEVKKGDVIIICVSGVAEDASEISVNLAFTKNVPDNIEINYIQEDKITGAGSFNIGEDDWEWVDIEDEQIDKAVLGDDGFYHLNSKDGPILFIDLVTECYGISIKDMNSVGRVKYSFVLEEGNYENGQYKAMIDAYLAAVEDGVVALTEELMNMMKQVGAGKGWYTTGAEWQFGCKVNADEAWMFLCKYAVEKEDDSKDEDNKDDSPVIEPDNKDEDKKDDSSVVEPDNKDNTEDKDDNKVPATADNSALMLSLVAMVVAMAGVAVVLTNKKKIA